MAAHPDWLGFPLSATTTFDCGRRIPAIERAQQYSFDAEHGRRGSEPCKGNLLHRTSPGCFWLSRRPSDHHQSKLPFNQYLSAVG